MYISNYFIYFTPHFNKFEKGVYWFHIVRSSFCPSICPSVYGQNGVCSVTSTIVDGSISYL